MNLFKNLFRNCTNINKLGTRITAFFLVVIMVMPLIPNSLKTVFANLQSYPTDLAIDHTGGSDNYEATISFWYRPSTEKDYNSNLSEEMSVYPHDAKYELKISNTSNKNTFSNILEGTLPGADGSGNALPNTYYPNDTSVDAKAFRNIDLSRYVFDGSLYSFRVELSHTHTYTPDGSTAPLGTSANYTAGGSYEEVLYLADLQVDAYGVGNELTVTWDAPLYDGEVIFTGYALHYILLSDDDPDPATVINSGTRYAAYESNVDRASSGLTSGVRGDGIRTLTQVITDSNIQQASVYAVVVEPFYTTTTELNRTDYVRYSSTTGQIQASSQYEILNPSTDEYVYMTYRSDNYYMEDSAYVKIDLKVQEDGSSNILLTWDEFNLEFANRVQEIKIYSGTSVPDDDANSIPADWNLEALLYATEATTLTYWRLPQPSVTTYYGLEVKLSDGSSTTVYIYQTSTFPYFDPNNVNLTPNRPIVEAYTEVGVPNPLLVNWSSFYRYAYNATEESQADSSNMFVDKDIFYDVYISDDLSAFNNGYPVSTLLPVLSDEVNLNIYQKGNYGGELEEGYLITSGGKTNAYVNNGFEKYYKNNDDTQYTIVGNKIYYVSVIAKSPTRDALGTVIAYNESQAGFVSVFIPDDTDISTPPAMATPPLQVKVVDDEPLIGSNYITTEWKQSWYEIYDEVTGKWYSEVARVDGVLVYGDDIPSGSELLDFWSADSLAAALYPFSGSVLAEDIRLVDMGDSLYQANVIPYRDLEQMMFDAGATDWKAFLDQMANDWDAEGWYPLDDQEIGPDNNGYFTYNYEDGNRWSIQPNTPYVILFRGYRFLEDGTKISYPTFLLATSKPDVPELDIDPTVPILYEDAHSSTSFTVWWMNQSSLGYELSYSDIFIDDPATGVLVSTDTINENSYLGDRVNPSGVTVGAKVYKQDGLFPGLSFYVWLRAYGTDGKISDWSNPVYITLDDYQAPSPPAGLGYIGTDSLAYVNLENTLSYEKRGSDYLFLEWLKDAGDTIQYTAPGTVGTGAESFVSSNIKATYNAKFNGLATNRPHYIRAKTILTITPNPAAGTENEDGTTVSPLIFDYSYVIEVSQYSDFKDSQTATVPVLNPTTAPVGDPYFLRLESDWSSILVLRTDGNDDDYDTDVDPDLVPLPETDFDITYNQYSNTLEFRFRSDQVDSEGNNDNSVDQRFITNLINNKTYTYGLDLTSYDDNVILNRTVEIPYNILSAFDEMKITLKIQAHNMTLSIPPGAFDTTEVKNLNNFGRGSSVTLKLSEFDETMPSLMYNESFASKPHHISVTVDSSGTTTALPLLAEPATLDMKISNRYLVEDTNVGAYYANGNTVSWTRTDGDYDSLSGNVSFDIKTLNTSYGVMSLDAPFVSSDDNVVVANVMTVSSVLYIPDIGVVEPTSTLSASQFNNVIAALAKGEKTVNINDPMTVSDFESLGKSGILVSGTYVPRENAIHALIRLYELKTKSSLKNYGTVQTSYFSDISDVNSQYLPSVLKAEYIGFLDDTDYIRADENLNFADLFSMVKIIIYDSGM